MSNRLLRFQIANTPVRAEWVELSDAWVQVVQRHELNDASVTMLGQLTAASLLLSATLKHQGSLTAQIVGDGPISLMVVECQASGAFRATTKMSTRHPMPAIAEPNVTELINPGGKARFAITLDPREQGKSAYQGIVPIEGDSVARMLERYMFRSEQLPTRLWLAADRNRVAGLLLQRMPDPGAEQAPDFDSDAWERVQKLAETLSVDEMLANDAETMLRRLFWQEQTGALDSRTMRFECLCSRDKVAAMLQMLGQPELESILAEQGVISVNCEYCNTPYRFDAVDAAALFESGLTPGPQTRH